MACLTESSLFLWKWRAHAILAGTGGVVVPPGEAGHAERRCLGEHVHLVCAAAAFEMLGGEAGAPTAGSSSGLGAGTADGAGLQGTGVTEQT